MLRVENNIAYVEGTAKSICVEFTHLVVQLITVLETEFNLSQKEAITVINESCKIAYMDEEQRTEMIKNLKGE